MPSESEKTYRSLNPHTGEVATTAAAATPVDADYACEAAQNAFLCSDPQNWTVHNWNSPR